MMVCCVVPGLSGIDDLPGSRVADGLVIQSVSAPAAFRAFYALAP